MKSSLFVVAVCGLAATMPGFAQSVISAKAGTIHYVEGTALINDQPVVHRPAVFSDLKNKEVLRTEEGRVEMLLAPGSFLRLSENSAVRMDSNSILATRLTMLEGTALIEVSELSKDSSLEITMGQNRVSVRKAGLYRLEMGSPAVKVFTGEIAVNSNDELVKVSEGKMITLTGDHLVTKFDKKGSTDELVQWADRRSGILSMANVASARTLLDTNALTASSWYYNNYFGMYTFVPYGGVFQSPFGYSYYSPRAVYSIYYPPVYNQNLGNNGFSGDRGQVGYNSGLGYNTSTMRSPSGYSGGGGNSIGASAPAAGGERAAGASAGGAVGRGGGSTGGRR